MQMFIEFSQKHEATESQMPDIFSRKKHDPDMDYFRNRSYIISAVVQWQAFCLVLQFPCKFSHTAFSTWCV